VAPSFTVAVAAGACDVIARISEKAEARRDVRSRMAHHFNSRKTF
jgi:hypothetical protein